MDTAPARPAFDDAERSRAEERLSAVASALAERYRVEREVGHGGMATVYLAEDLRHHRRVAVKVLHPELGAALGGERFLREIEVTAALHHPHILPLHDSGEARGLLYYVMPFVEGESLRELLRRERQLAVDEAVRIACDVAAALDYAHRKGVLHRDVKPENVLLHDGRAVVADFGVARAVQRAADNKTLTGTGVAVGTPQYMSPEQASGERELDARTDVFALGSVMYEMLAGNPPFSAPTAQAVIAKVLGEQPRALSAERRAVPAHVSIAVMKALEKLPADRFATAAQFAAAIAPPAATMPSMEAAATTPAGAPVVRRLRLTRRDAAWAALATALGVAGYAVSSRNEGAVHVDGARPARFTLTIADSQRLAGSPSPVAISPDGQTVVYTGEAGPGRRILYRRPLDDLTATPIAGTEGAGGATFSPDGEWVVFNDDAGQLKRVPVGGGSVSTIAAVSGATNGRAWGPNDKIVTGSSRGLVRVSAAGGVPQPLTVVDTARGEVRHADPLFLPDGKTIAFRISVSGEADVSRIGLVESDGRAAREAGPLSYTTLDVRGGTPLGYRDGVLIVAHPDGTVSAVPLDYRRKVLTGSPVQVLDHVAYNRGASAALSKNGSLVYVRGVGGALLQLVDDRGARLGGSPEPRRYQHPRFSPDGRRIAVAVVSPEAAISDIWVYDLPSGPLSRLTFRGGMRQVWTPDGKRIAYVRDGGDLGEAWWVAADRSGTEERLYAVPRADSPDDRLGVSEIELSPNGRFAVLRIGSGAPRTNDLWLLPLDSATGAPRGQATPLFQTRFSEAMPRISPDGRWLAYASDETGQYEVYVRPFPGPGGPSQVSTGGAAEPVWTAANRLVYRAGESFVTVTLDLPSTKTDAHRVSVAARQSLFATRYQTTLPLLGPAQFDAHPDGKRFAVVQRRSEDREVVIVLDWLAEVRSRLTAGSPR